MHRQLSRGLITLSVAVVATAGALAPPAFAAPFFSAQLSTPSPGTFVSDSSPVSVSADDLAMACGNAALAAIDGDRSASAAAGIGYLKAGASISAAPGQALPWGVVTGMASFKFDDAAVGLLAGPVGGPDGPPPLSCFLDCLAFTPRL